MVKADGSVVFVTPASFQSFWRAITRDFVNSIGRSPVSKILSQTGVRKSIMASSPALTKSAVMLSTPAVFPLLLL